MLTTLQSLIIVSMLMLGTCITRFLPFLLYPDAAAAPRFIAYLGKVLPAAAIGLLVVYCIRDIDFVISPHGLPEMIAIASVVVLHIWKKNILLSIGTGTVLYMLLVQVLFA